MPKCACPKVRSHRLHMIQHTLSGADDKKTENIEAQPDVPLCVCDARPELVCTLSVVWCSPLPEPRFTSSFISRNKSFGLFLTPLCLSSMEPIRSPLMLPPLATVPRSCGSPCSYLRSHLLPCHAIHRCICCLWLCTPRHTTPHHTGTTCPACCCP